MSKKISISAEDFTNLHKSIGAIEHYFELENNDIGIDKIKIVDSIVSRYITL